MAAYKDGDSGFSILRPGEGVPAPTGPAEGGDFGWVKTGPLDRWRGARVARSIEGLTRGLKTTTGYNVAATKYEESRQALALVRERGDLLPLQKAQDRERLETEIVQGRLAADAMVQEHQQAMALAAKDHEIELLNRKAEKLQAKARVKEAKRALKEAGKKKAPQAAAGSEGPAEFERHYQTAQKAKGNLSEGKRRVREIYAAAADERRQLTDEEMMEVDAINDAARAAADEVRRGAASDL